MLILNVGCGSVRPGPPFVNVDCLRTQLAVGTPERANLDVETNYAEVMLPERLPFPDQHFDACCAIHVIEHFDCMDAVKILADCHRLLKPGGMLVVSVPDAAYFLSVFPHDKPENAVELFGEPINLTEASTFFDYALFFRDHKQVLTAQALRCLLLKAGFQKRIQQRSVLSGYPYFSQIESIMNRRKFSLELYVIKGDPITTAPPATSAASAP